MHLVAAALMLAAVTLLCCPWHHVDDGSDFAVVVSHGVTVLWRKAVKAPFPHNQCQMRQIQADSNLIQLPASESSASLQRKSRRGFTGIPAEILAAARRPALCERAAKSFSGGFRKRRIRAGFYCVQGRLGPGVVL